MMKTPKFVALEITSRCQLQCKGCFSSNEDYSKGDMEPKFFYSVIDRMSKDMILNPYANGEPLLHPNVLDFVKYATERGIRHYITTNGMIWNESLFTYMLEHFPTSYQIVFSLDGLWGSPSIELARPGSNEERIRKNIEGFLALKKKLGSKLTVMVKICERGQDFEEIENYISYWLKQEGINAVIVGKLFDNFATGGMRMYPCQYSDNVFMLVRWDRKAVVCMYHPRVMNEGLLPIGHLDYDTPIVEFYNNPAYTAFREAQARGEFPVPCKTCGISYTGTGSKGIIHFRNKELIQAPIHYRFDHYNSFFSLEDNSRPDSWYGYKK